MTVVTVIWPPPRQVDAVIPLIDAAFNNHTLLTQKMLELVAVPPRPYALFHHNSYLYERMKDVRTITIRLGDNRKELNALTLKESKLRPKKQIYKQTLSKRLQAVVRKSEEVHHQMKLDMEAFYIFGNLLLDQWAYVIGYLIGDNDPTTFNFRKLVEQVQKKGDKGLLEPLWQEHRNDILWLFYQLRMYRNIFIEHVRLPWQRGTSRETYRDDFSLASPVAVGWIDENEVEKEIRSIDNFAPLWARSPYMNWHKGNIRQLLQITFYHIDSIEKQADREKVWQVWEKVGGWTPSYDLAASRLMRFAGESFLTVLDIISRYPDAIKAGAAQTNRPN